MRQVLPRAPAGHLRLGEAPCSAVGEGLAVGDLDKRLRIMAPENTTSLTRCSLVQRCHGGQPSRASLAWRAAQPRIVGMVRSTDTRPWRGGTSSPLYVKSEGDRR